MSRRLRLTAFICLLSLSLLACEPVLAVGWQEILIVFALLTFLVGPTLYNLYQRWEKFKANIRPKDKNK